MPLYGPHRQIEGGGQGVHPRPAQARFVRRVIAQGAVDGDEVRRSSGPLERDHLRDSGKLPHTPSKGCFWFESGARVHGPLIVTLFSKPGSYGPARSPTRGCPLRPSGPPALPTAPTTAADPLEGRLARPDRSRSPRAPARVLARVLARGCPLRPSWASPGILPPTGPPDPRTRPPSVPTGPARVLARVLARSPRAPARAPARAHEPEPERTSSGPTSIRTGRGGPTRGQEGPKHE